MLFRVQQKWSENKEAKIINEQLKEIVRKAPRGRVSLHGICDIRMPCLLNFMNFIIKNLSTEDLNAQVTCHEKVELKLAKLEGESNGVWQEIRKMIRSYGSSSIKKVAKCLLGKEILEMNAVLLFAK
ncbi:hypothetical protein PRO82_000953 [Candidatus Protochlamydia amoebophila]|nr:hypothetical protein [Candidatus Protochlamydia amoebophila]